MQLLPRPCVLADPMPQRTNRIPISEKESQIMQEPPQRNTKRRDGFHTSYRYLQSANDERTEMVNAEEWNSKDDLECLISNVKTMSLFLP